MKHQTQQARWQEALGRLQFLSDQTLRRLDSLRYIFRSILGSPLPTNEHVSPTEIHIDLHKHVAVSLLRTRLQRRRNCVKAIQALVSP